MLTVPNIDLMPWPRYVVLTTAQLRAGYRITSESGIEIRREYTAVFTRSDGRHIAYDPEYEARLRAWNVGAATCRSSS